MTKGFEPIGIIHADAAIHYGQKAYRRLATIIHKGNIPHALLFSGINGVGKRSAALSLAMACNCAAEEQPESPPSRATTIPCGVCKPCRKIKTGNHPDIHIIEPAGRFIKIDRIRELLSALDMKPNEARWRFVLIPEAQHMNPEASNALLKMLEEPPQQTVLLLTVEQHADLLPTIVSRCRHLRFNPLPDTEIQRWLVEQRQAPEHIAQPAALMAQGSLARAAELADINLFRKKSARRNWLLEHSGLSDVTKKPPIPLILAFAAHIAHDKDTLLEDLDILYLWIRDLLMGKVAPHRIINADAAATINRISSAIAVEALLHQIHIIEWARKALMGNANPRLTAEAMIIRLLRTR